MKKPNITPGPWNKRPFGPIANTVGNVRYIAEVCPHAKGDKLDEEDEANAKAISALPECLAALESTALSKEHEPNPNDNGDPCLCFYCRNIRQAKAALEKAGYQF